MTAKNPLTGKSWLILPAEHLTPLQEKQMSTQPDMILQFAHYMAKIYEKQGLKNIEIRADAYVALNGKGGRSLIDPTIDLTKQEENLYHKTWILPYEQQVMHVLND